MPGSKDKGDPNKEQTRQLPEKDQPKNKPDTSA